MVTWFLACSIAIATAVIATRGAMALGICDVPDEARKLHKTVTPTSGGIGIVAGVFASAAFLIWTAHLQLNTGVIMCLGVSLGAGVLGLFDDIYRLSAKLKLVVMLILVVAFSLLGDRIETLTLLPNIIVPLGSLLGTIGTVFWLLVMVNTVNFMDGANGMAMGCSGIGLLGLAGLLVLMPVAGPQSYHLASLGVIGFGACCGFLVWNAGLGRVFSGDVGALFVGLLCGTLGVLAVRVGANPFSVVLCFLPMLIDVILTIILRLSRGENVLQAHAKHGYQLSIRNGASHLATSSYYWFLTAGCALIAVMSQIVGGGAPFGGFALYLFILCVLYFYRLHKIPAGNRTDDLD